jgi:hypothetical protein
MNVKLLIVAIAVFVLFILSLPLIFHYKTETNEKEIAKEKCINACRQAMINGIDLSNGPCLLDPIPELKNWVCDVAHNPRELEIDNKPENQCSSFREGKANHFVEVDTACRVINVYYP